jgi:hypothetical protein
VVLVCAVQPVGEIGGGFVRGGAVERHHRGGNSWKFQDVRPPPHFVDLRHLDEIVSAGDDSLETLPHSVRLVMNF